MSLGVVYCLVWCGGCPTHSWGTALVGALSSLLILRVLVKPRHGGLRHDLSPAEIKGSSPRLSAGFLGVSYHLRVLQESFQSHDEAGRRCLYQASLCTYLFNI